MVPEERDTLSHSLPVIKVEPAEFVGAVRTATQPEDMMLVTVLGKSPVNPLTAAAFKTVKQRPLIAKQRSCTIIADRNNSTLSHCNVTC
jgi:hypothetical protein